MTDLIYDVGMDDGDDSEFYLLKGFRVVAVEADPDLCRAAGERFQPFLQSGLLTIVNRAIVPKAGPATFYRSSNPGWGTVAEDWHRYNVAHGVAADSLVVAGQSLGGTARSRSTRCWTAGSTSPTTNRPTSPC